MGLVILLLMIAAAAGALWLLKLRGGLLTAAAAALLLGGAGYALQGSPDDRAAPAPGRPNSEYLPLTDARHAFFGDFAPAEPWLRISEALARNGNGVDAVGILENATHRYPGDAQLWIGLGNSLVDHANGLTPAGELAFRRASEAAPGHPAARFFYGLALARSGDRESAVTLWRQILADAPSDASWRPLVEQGIAVLDRPAPARR
ncbi:MAG: hypothetical protein ABIO80_04470 [Sphingomicrobium sp.]